MEQQPSPEEILLRLIKEGKSSKGTPPTPVACAPAPQSKPLVARKPPKFHDLSEKIFTDLDFIPRIFLFLSLALASLILFRVVYDSLRSKQHLNRLWQAGSSMDWTKQNPPGAFTPKVIDPALPEKDLFKFLDESTISAPSGASSPRRIAKLENILANYVLSGIIGGDQPQAVIEDKKEGKTYFLNVGDTLGDLRIVAITEGKVTVAVGDEQADLNL